jgi:hypothetical protein
MLPLCHRNASYSSLFSCSDTEQLGRGWSVGEQGGKAAGAEGVGPGATDQDRADGGQAPTQLGGDTGPLAGSLRRGDCQCLLHVPLNQASRVN